MAPRRNEAASAPFAAHQEALPVPLLEASTLEIRDEGVPDIVLGKGKGPSLPFLPFQDELTLLSLVAPSPEAPSPPRTLKGKRINESPGGRVKRVRRSLLEELGVDSSVLLPSPSPNIITTTPEPAGSPSPLPLLTGNRGNLTKVQFDPTPESGLLWAIKSAIPYIPKT